MHGACKAEPLFTLRFWLRAIRAYPLQQPLRALVKIRRRNKPARAVRLPVLIPEDSRIHRPVRSQRPEALGLPKTAAATEQAQWVFTTAHTAAGRGAWGTCEHGASVPGSVQVSVPDSAYRLASARRHPSTHHFLALPSTTLARTLWHTLTDETLDRGIWPRYWVPYPSQIWLASTGHPLVREPVKPVGGIWTRLVGSLLLVACEVICLPARLVRQKVA